jgi:DNA/RNA non-specific endonuclease
MTSAIGPSSASALSNTQSSGMTQTPEKIVKDIIAQNSDKLGRINYSALARDLDSAKANFPDLGAAIEQETAAQLGPRAMAKLENAVYAITAPDGSTLTISRNAPSIESYFKGTAHAADAKTPEQRAANRKSDLAHYAKLDRIFGDGNAKTFDGPKIQAGIDEALRTGSSFEQTAKNIAARETAAANADSQAASELAKDLGQMALDVVGIFDPTPTADLINAGISAWRGDGWGAFLSVVSAVPYVGDLAKLGKLGKWAKTIANAVELAAKNPAMRAMLQPALRKISDLIGALPAAAFNALPTDAKTALLDMKSKIDGLMGKAGTKVNDVPPPRPAMVDGRQQYYFDMAGKKGAWNKELNKKLAPNADYHVNGYKFSTDAKGRVTSVEGQLVMTQAERNTYQQGVAGRAYRLPDDQGGHLIASIFNGPGEAVNLKAMNGNFNMGAFRDLERTLADAVASGKKVEVKIDVVHSGDSLRPDQFVVKYQIDAGRPVSVEFDNVVGGKQ